MRDGSANARSAARRTRGARRAVVSRFAEDWFMCGRPACDFDEGVDPFVMLFFNALQLKRAPERPGAASSG